VVIVETHFYKQHEMIPYDPIFNLLLFSPDADSNHLSNNHRSSPGPGFFMKQDSGPIHILIVRLSAIGDIVMASSLVNALRRRYPDARIGWLVQPEGRALLEYHPDLGEVIIWPRGEWQRLLKDRRWGDLWREIRGFRRELRRHCFDLAIDAQGLLKSGFLTWLSGAKERIGLGSREGSRFLMTKVIEKGGDPRRIGSEYLHLARALGLPVDNFEMQVAVGEADKTFADSLMRNQGLEAGYAVICPFTTRPQKHWFEQRWIELIPRINRELGLPVLMLGGPGDGETASRIADGANGQIVNQVGATSLTQAAALIKYASLLIGVDTGLSHMGIAFNRPTVCLFGSTCPYLDTTRENAVVLYHPMECSPCKRNPVCSGGFDCMAAITGDEVMDTAKSLLSGRESAQ
jgi:heptosyltransferase-1